MSAVCLLLGSGCGPGKTAATGTKPADGPARQVQVAPVTEKLISRSVPVTGSLVAQDEATLSMKVAGRLEAFHVDLGSAVKRGQLLAQVEPTDYDLKLKQATALLAQSRARVGLPVEGTDDKVDLEASSTVRQAKALLEEASKNRDRVTKLSKDGILSESELETAEAGHQVSYNKYLDAQEEMKNRHMLLAQRRVEYDIARQQLADTKILAPFDGSIQERRANLGEYQPIGAPVLTLVRMDPLRLRVDVPERSAVNVRVGQPVRLYIDGDTTIHTGEIKRLSPAINPLTRMLLAEADVRNDGSLRPGSFIRGEIVTRANVPAVVVAPKALFAFAGLEKVFVADKGKAVERNVITGDRGTNWVEIVSGVRPGELVILEPGGLQTGQPVVVKD
jgi:RND family efflux transporter MFP subunit